MKRAKEARPTGQAYTSPREVRPFDVTLTPEERRELSSRFEEADDALEAASESERERRKGVRAELDTLRETKRAIRSVMRSGVERRQIVCEWSVRDGGERVLVRTDTGEVIEVQAQRVLA